MGRAKSGEDGRARRSNQRVKGTNVPRAAEGLSFECDTEGGPEPLNTGLTDRLIELTEYSLFSTCGRVETERIVEIEKRLRSNIPQSVALIRHLYLY
jgi:hypothetical protein